MLIFLGIGEILAFSTPNTSRSKKGAALKKSLAPPIFYTFRALLNVRIDKSLEYLEQYIEMSNFGDLFRFIPENPRILGILLEQVTPKFRGWR